MDDMEEVLSKLDVLMFLVAVLIILITGFAAWYLYCEYGPIGIEVTL